MAAPAQRRGPQYASFRDRKAFPVFTELPAEFEFHPDYYVQQSSSTAGHRKHWAFLSEIVQIERLTRLVLNVRDRAGSIVRVAFYTERRGNEIEERLLKPGYTVLNLYGLQHQFLDGTVGIREEDLDSVKIIPMSLDSLLHLSDSVLRYSTCLSDNLRTCHGCDEKKEDMHKCSKCGMFWYCSKECQTVGWTEKGHKQDCPILRDKDIKGLLEKDWYHFDEFIRIPF